MTDQPSEAREVAVFETGGELSPFMPQNLTEALKLANAIHQSGLAPESLDSPTKVLVAMMAGAELGLPPFQAVQSFAVVGNRPVLWGDGLMAVMLKSGFKIREWMEGEGEERVAYCEVSRPGRKEVVVRSFSVEDAKIAKLWMKKTKNGYDTPWITSPDRMLQMRARAFACRDSGADVLKGFKVGEEVMDYAQPDKPPRGAKSGLRARLQAAKKADEGFNTEQALAGQPMPVADTERPPEIAPEMAESQNADTPEPAVSDSPAPVSESGDAAPADASEARDAADGPVEPSGESGESDEPGWIDEYMESIDAAPTPLKLKMIRAQFHTTLQLFSSVDATRHAALDRYFNNRLAELEAG